MPACAASVGDLHAALNQVYGLSRWHHPPKYPARRWLSAQAQCVPGGPAAVRKARRKFETHRAYRLVAPFPGWKDEGYWLTWLAVPRWVVDAETRDCDARHSGLARGNCRWHIVNRSSGACGPYQELDHIPCDSPPLAHHRLAHSLPRGSWAVGY